MEELLDKISNNTPKELNALIIASSYWGYPKEKVKGLLHDSELTLKKFNVNLTTLGPIVDFQSAKKFKIKGVLNNYDFVVLLIMTWTELADMFYLVKDFLDKPVLLWSHTMWYVENKNEYNNLGAFAGAGVARKTLKDFGAKFKFIYGMPGDKKINQELKLFISAVKGVKKLNYSRVGLLGAPSMGMYTAWQDPLILEKILGPNVHQIDQYLLIEKLEKYKTREVHKELINEVKSKWVISDGIDDELIIQNINYVEALIELINEYFWDGFTIKCQYELSTHYKFTPCLPLSIISDLIPCSCEGDLPLLTTQLIFNAITGKPVTYCDIHNITSNSILMAACGFSPLSLINGKPIISKHSALYSGLLNVKDYIEGEVTVGRIFVDHDSKAYFHFVRGIAKTPKKPFRELGCSLYPSMEIFIEDADSFAQNIASQHYAIVFKDIYNEVVEFCKIKAVNII
jgi:L-fucose isomerase-like protein